MEEDGGTFENLKESVQKIKQERLYLRKVKKLNKQRDTIENAVNEYKKG